MATWLLDVRGKFGHNKEKNFPITIGLTKKGDMDEIEFTKYLKNLIIPIFPNTKPVLGKWVDTKVDCGLGRTSNNLLATLRFHGFILFPGVPNTTAVTQETDRIYNVFKTCVRINPNLLIKQRIIAGASKLMQPWMCGLIIFGGTDPDTGYKVEVSPFNPAFTKKHCKSALEAIGEIFS